MTGPGKTNFRPEITKRFVNDRKNMKGLQILFAAKKKLSSSSFFDAWREKKYVKDEREGMKIY